MYGFQPVVSATGINTKNLINGFICAKCGTKTKPITVTRGTIWIEIVLWLFLLIPGIVYTIWRLTSKYKACSICKSPDIVPLDSPRGKKLTTEFGAMGSRLHSYGMTHQQIDDLIQKCKVIEDEEYKCEIADPLLPILSPIAGTVIYRDAILGEHIMPEKVLFSISDLKKLWAVLDAYEKDIPYIYRESRVTIHSSLYPEKEFVGKISYISDLIDEKLRTLKVRVEVDNAENLLKPNMYIQGSIENPVLQEKALAVLDDAVQSLDGEKIVFVLESENIFAVKHVQIGHKIGKQRIITSGLKENDKIVVRGAFSLKTELTKSKFGHKHVH